MIKFLIILLLTIDIIRGQRKVLIGGIFDGENYESEVAFRYSLRRANEITRNFQLVPLIKYAPHTDSFKTEQIVCEMVAEGVAAIFGPSSRKSSGIVGSICNAMEIPHILTHWSPTPLGGRYHPHRMTINFYPDSEVIARAMADVIIDYTWKSYTIVYETEEGLMRLKDILQIHNSNNDPITVFQLGDGPDYRPLLKKIQASGESHIILDVSGEKVLDILRQAESVKMLEEYQRYILTGLDSHTIDFAELKLKSYRSNITAVRIIDVKRFEVTSLVNDWVYGEQNQNRMFRVSPENVKTESALIHDAVKLFSAAVRELDSADEIIPGKNSCKKPSTWKHGMRIVNFMKVKTDFGITGDIVLNEEGQRTQFHLEVIELLKDGFKKIATWSANDGAGSLNYTRSTSEVELQIVESLQNKTFVIAVKLGAPFLINRTANDGETLVGNDRYEGYSVDLIGNISAYLGCKFELEVVKDGQFGAYNKETKEWNGLVRQLLDRKADLAIGDLTITYERRAAVDFTSPFMTLGISILYAKPVKPPGNIFAFLSPLSLEVWLYIGTTYLIVSLVIFALARLAPADWENPHPCDQNPEEVENIWIIPNSMWLMMGSIMGQGSDLAPKANSTRIVASIWFFFALIMLASYTANLAAFLTTTRSNEPIKSAEDLAKQSKITYGAVSGGSTLSFFQNSKFSTYQRMWAVMENEKPSVFVSANPKGVERVQKGKGSYAFFMESTLIEYELHTKCDLTQIGGLLDSKSYGIAMPVNSPYRTLISGTVLKLQENGTLQRMKEKWWKTRNNKDPACPTDDISNDDAELGIDNVGGVFLVLGIGVCAAYLIVIFEFLWNVKSAAVLKKITLWESFVAEMKFVIDIRITTKPVNSPERKTNNLKSSHDSSISLSDSR